MGMMQRRKGATAEREAASLIRDLTGWDCQRRVRQHDGDSDLLGVHGWTLEVKRYAKATRGDIARFYEQAVTQAQKHGGIPCLLYRLNRDEWRAVWPVSIYLVGQTADMWRDYCWAADTSVEAWASVARELYAPNLENARVEGADVVGVPV